MLRRAAALALLGASTITYGAEDEGLYAGVGIGQSQVRDSEAGLTFKATSTAFKILAGYQINRNFAIEGAYIDVGAPSDTIQGITAKLDSTAFQATLVGKMPFNPVVSGIAKAGILFWNSTTTASNGFSSFSAKDSGNEFSWGLGLEFGLRPKTKARLEFEGADINGTEYRLISASISWLFN